MIGKRNKKKNKDLRKSIGDKSFGLTEINRAKPKARLVSTRSKSKREKERRDAQREQQRKNISDSLATPANLKSKNSKLEYKIRLRTDRRKNNESGVNISSTIRKRKQRESQGDAKKTLRIDRIKMDDSSQLKDTIDVINTSNNAKPEDSLGDIEFDVSGIQDLELLQAGLQELDPSISINYFFRDVKGAARKLEDGFGGIKTYLESATGSSSDNDAINRIKDKIDEAIVESGKTQQTVEEVDQAMNLNKEIKFLIESEQGKLTGDKSEKEFLIGLNVAISNQIKFDNQRLSLLRKPLLETQVAEKISENFIDLVKNKEIPQINKDRALVFLGKLTKIVTSANLTKEETDSLFNKVIDYHPETTDEIQVGGEVSAFLRENFLENTLTEYDAEKVEDLFRDQVSSALRRIKKRVDPNDLDPGIFKTDFINKVAPNQNSLLVNIDNSPSPEPAQLNIINRFLLKRKLKDHKKVINIEETNGTTASEVFKVRTLGPIGNSGTNEGFAKYSTKKGDIVNDGVAKLKFNLENVTTPQGVIQRLKEDPKLLARQVVSSRLADALRIDVIPTEIFSEAKGQGAQEKDIIGISAKVPGVAVKDTDVSKRVLHRNLEFENANTQKSFSTLQLFDAFVGQVDRHGGNIFVDPKTGKAYGIDPDLAFPKGHNEEGEEKKYDDTTALKDQFTRKEDGVLVFNMELIDIEDAAKFQSISREEVESIIRGRDSDPEKLDDKDAIAYTLERFDAIIRKIKDLETNGDLINVWNDKTYKRALQEGNKGGGKYTNYIARSVGEFEDAGLAGNPASFQGL